MARTKLFDALKGSMRKAYAEKDVVGANNYADLAWDELFAHCLPMNEDDMEVALSGMMVTAREWIKMFSGKHRIHARD